MKLKLGEFMDGHGDVEGVVPPLTFCKVGEVSSAGMDGRSKHQLLYHLFADFFTHFLDTFEVIYIV